MTYKKFMLAIMCTFFFGLLWGIGIYHFAWKDICQKQQDLPNPTTSLQTQVDVLTGQVKVFTNLYNDHSYRIQTIEDRMKIFNREEG